MFGLAYIYGAELFPTIVRSKCMGFCISIGRGVSTFAPFINLFMTTLGLNPLLAYGVIGLACLPLLGMLPETFGKKLPDNLEEFNNNPSVIKRSAVQKSRSLLKSKSQSYLVHVPA